MTKKQNSHKDNKTKAAVKRKTSGKSRVQKPANSEVAMPLTYDRWIKKFKPIKNPMSDDDAFEGLLFETFGPELERVMKEPANKVWTLVDNDSQVHIISGYHLVNRQGYFICKVPSDCLNQIVIDMTRRFITADSPGAEDVPENEKWKFGVGEQCNILLDLIEVCEESSKPSDWKTAAKLRSIVSNLAHYANLTNV